MPTVHLTHLEINSQNVSVTLPLIKHRSTVEKVQDATYKDIRASRHCSIPYVDTPGYTEQKTLMDTSENTFNHLTDKRQETGLVTRGEGNACFVFH